MWLTTGLNPRELGELRRRDPLNYELLEAGIRARWRLMFDESKT